MQTLTREVVFDRCNYWLESEAFELEPPNLMNSNAEMFGLRLFLSGHPFDAGHLDFMPERHFRAKLKGLNFSDGEIEHAIDVCRAAGPRQK
jgi:hypothetical protein